jgi:uncharacterized membrane protein YebE (DUF533 family)
VDQSQLLSMFLRGAMGSKGRKRARKAAKFLGGNKGFLTASTVLGAAGVAWGIYETLQNQGTSTAAPPAAPYSPGVTGAAAASTVPPPLPGNDRVFPDDVLRVVRLAVSAARADGTLLPAERALILSHAREAGLESVVELELASPRALSDIVAGVGDEQRKRDLYVLAYTIVRADETVSGAERVYLAQLAHQLGLSPSVIAELERSTAASIDAEPDDPSAPGTAAS